MTNQPALGSRLNRFVEADGLKFRDLDGDGQLAPYEDWRLPADERADDLVTRMKPEEKIGMMVIGSHYPGYSEFIPHADPNNLLNPEDVWRDHNPITSQEYPEPILVTSSTDNAINVRHQRYLIVRDNLEPRDLAVWTNAVQEVAEKSRLGIPVVFASNPRNHFALVAEFGVSESTGVFSEWPGELGLAALDDAQLIETYGKEIAKEWRAGGIHKIYGYMADVASEPRWSRFNGTFGEDVDLVTRYMAALTRGMQGSSLSEASVATTVKHFPGGGVRLDGHDPHFEWGQTNEYPTEGALYKYHLPPFQAAVDEGCASIMPYYAKPVNSSAEQLPEELWEGPTTQFEEVAFAYNNTFIEKMLRQNMGFDGYINSDSGIIDAMMWGVEDLTKPERFAKAVEVGTDIVSDMSDPTELQKAFDEGILEEKFLDRAVKRLLIEMFQLGLFDNPYVDEDIAEQIIGNDTVNALAQTAQRQSVTLLRNADLLPLDLEAAKKVYVYTTGRTKIDEVDRKFKAAFADTTPNYQLVESPEEADFAVVWARPDIALFEDDRPGVSLSIEPRNNGVDVDRVIEIEKTVPTILVVNFTNPWLLTELEPEAAAVVGTYEISPANLLKSLAGEDGGPKGKLPMSVPASAETVAESPRDVPGKYLENYAYVDREGVAYEAGFGLSF
ncbi:glycoside hydrolase family 3 N-terminal domain-containing protein [Corynebacterium breve]|uniref:beta-glucosidase n=1 Tax=Corynebacterium breve TaxID=3049799 RepID=A0ABY8VEM5_9CORY|nr:glycoside hydrolase family 3 N-terminal domain-containing protein [Corynebacterium breve]WIM67963.1 glycoside hydrolase family 3 N-terminal domain-containing protein [Corynebacterium breve]